MYQRCNSQCNGQWNGQQLAGRGCIPNPHEDVENEIEIEKKFYEVEESINTSINNKGFLIQLQIGALIIFDDVFGSTANALANINGNPFEIKLDENGKLSINGNKIAIESLSNGNKTVVIKNGVVSTI